MAKNFSGLMVGIIFGLATGLVADYSITNYILLNAERPEYIIIANASSAFILVPVCTIIGAILGYKIVRKY